MLAADKWIALHSAIEPARLHAIGVIAYFMNECERSQFYLFCDVIKLPEEEAWPLVFDLGDESVSIRIRTLMAVRAIDPKARDLVENALKVYSACRQNRNTVIHAWSVGAFATRKLARRSKKPLS